MDLYGIVHAGSETLLWGGWTTAEDAERVAVQAAVNHGNVNLLSGVDLGRYLVERGEA